MSECVPANQTSNVCGGALSRPLCPASVFGSPDTALEGGKFGSDGGRVVPPHTYSGWNFTLRSSRASACRKYEYVYPPVARSDHAIPVPLEISSETKPRYLASMEYPFLKNIWRPLLVPKIVCGHREGAEAIQ
jgi:hypothetical protein